MANSAEFTMVFKVREDGSLVLAEKNIRKAGKAVGDLSTAQGDAAKNANKHRDALNGGVASANNSARSMSKLLDTVGGNNSGLVAAYATLATNAFAVSAAFSALRNAAQVEQMMKGLETQGARTGKSLIRVSQSLQKITDYSISAADAMQATALMSSAGFSAKGMKDLTQVAYDASLALGRNVPDSLDRISKGVTKLEPELLDELGIMTKLTEAQSQYALTNNKSVQSLSSFEKRQAMLNAVVTEGTIKFGGLSKEIGANPYDKLAASFSNLITTIESGLNTILTPLVALFGGNQTALLGGIILFVSTIRKQMLPALYAMGQLAQKRQQNFVNMAAEARDAAKATLELANAQQKAAVSSKAEKLIGPELRTKATSKGFDYEAAAVSAVDQDAEAHAKNIAKLDNSISTRMKNIRRERGELTEQEIAAGVVAKGWSKNYIDTKEAEVRSIQKVKAALEDLYNTQKKGESGVIAARAKSKAENTKFRANEKAALSEKLKGESIELAGEGKIREAMAKRREALQEEQKKLKYERIARSREGITQLPPIFDKLKLGMTGVSTGAQLASTAFMKFIPYIGWATTAVGALWAAYENWGRSEATKVQIKAMEDLKLANEAASKSAKEFQRIQELNVPLGQKIAQSLTIQSNTTAQISQAFKEAQEAIKSAIKADKNKDTASTFWQSIIGNEEDITSYATGIARNSKFLPAVQKELENSTAAQIGALAGGIPGLILEKITGKPSDTRKIGMYFAQMLPPELAGLNQEAIESAKAMDNLSRVMDQDVYNAMVKAYGGIDKLANSNGLRKTFIQEAATAYEGLADAVSALSEAYKKTGDAITKFFNDAIPKTPFDELIDGFRGINEQFYQLSKVAGSAGAIKQMALLSNMPDELKRLLDPKSRQTVEDFKTADVNANKAKALKEEYESTIATLEAKRRKTEEDKYALAIAQQRLPVERKNLEAAEAQKQAAADHAEEVKTNLLQTQQQLTLYQNQVRNQQNQLTLANAITKAYSEFYSQTASGTKLRLERENQAIELQKAQIQAQLSMIEIYANQATAQLNLLKIEQERLKAGRELSLQEATNEASAAQAVMSAARGSAVDTGINQDWLSGVASHLRSIQDTTSKAFTDYKALTDAQEKSWTVQQVTEAKSYISAVKNYEIATRLRDKMHEVQVVKLNINDLDQQQKALSTSIAALSSQQLNKDEINVRVKEAQAEQTRQMEATEQKIVSLKSQNKVLDDKITASLTGRQGALKFELAASLSQLKIDRDAAELETKGTIGKLKGEQEIAKAALTRKDLDEEHRKLLNEIITNKETEIAKQVEINNLTQEQINLKAKQSIIEQIIGSGIQFTSGKLKESIDLLERRALLTQEVADKESRLAQARSTLAVTKAGGTVNERAQKQFAVESAQIALNAAEENYRIRMESIKAEYQLLAAQKDVQVEEIKSRVFFLSALMKMMGMQDDTGMKQNLQNLVDAASNLQTVDYSKMQRAAERSAYLDVELARTNLEQAKVARDVRPIDNAVLNFFRNLPEEMASKTREIAAAQAGEDARRIAAIEKPKLTIDQGQLQQLLLQTSYLKDILETLSKNTLIDPKDIKALSTPTTQVVAEGDRLPATAASLATVIKEVFGANSYIGDNSQHSKFVKGTKRISEHWGPNANADDWIPEGGLTKYTAATAQKMLEEGLAKHGLKIGKGTTGATQFFGPGKPTKPGDTSHENHFHTAVEAMADTTTRAITTINNAVSNITGETAAEASKPKIDEQRRKEVTDLKLQADYVATTAGQVTEKTTQAVTKATMDFGQLVIGLLDSALADMDKLGQQMAERLGQDFGPQGRVISALSNLINETRNFSKDISDSWKGLFPKTPVGIGGPINDFPVAMNAQSVSAVSGMVQPVNTTLAGSISAAAPAAPLTGGVDNLGSSVSGLSGLSQTTTELSGGLDNLASKAAETAKVSTDSIKAASAEVNVAQTKTTEGFNKQMQSASVAFGAIAGMIGAVAGLLKASSDAKIAGIDKEIAAEQKRDGKSAASVAKLDALEKKKDAQARKSFNVQKKLMMAQAVMSTAAGIAGALGSNPGITGIILASIIGAMGAAQIAIIAGTQYESSYTPKSVSTPTNLSIGKRGDSVDLAKGSNATAGGEVGYLRGSEGQGTNASNYRTVGSAYGGELMRGYGNRGFVVGEKGPEVITPETPISVTPANDVGSAQPINANFTIQALDSHGVQDILVSQKGNIIKMLREAANASGKTFMEDVNVNVYTRPSVGKL